jgi:hypothetical protein
MLNSHPRIYIPPESDFIPRFFLRNPQKSLSPRNIEQIINIIFTQYRFVREWQGRPLRASDFSTGSTSPTAFLDTLYGTYARQNNAHRWGDKTPIYSSYVGLLSQLFPDAQFVHLVRDGRDVALSMLDKWGEQDFHIDIYFAARNWVRRTCQARQSREYLGSSRYYELQYENLVAAPEEELKLLCDYLGENYLPEMASPQQLARTNIEPGSFHAPLLKPPSTNRIGRWQHEMEPADLRLFQSVAGNLLQMIGYPLAETGSQSFLEKLREGCLALKYSVLQGGRRLATVMKVLPPI